MVTDWKQIDEKLIRRGELILELGFVEGYREELQAINRGKEGRPYSLSRTYIQFLTAVRYLYRMPYRQLEPLRLVNGHHLNCVDGANVIGGLLLVGFNSRKVWR